MQQELHEHIPEIRLCPKFADSNYMAYLLDVTVAELNDVYGQRASGSQLYSAGGSGTLDGDVEIGDAEMDRRADGANDDEDSDNMGGVLEVGLEGYNGLGDPNHHKQSTPLSKYSPLLEAPMVCSLEPECTPRTLQILYVPNPSRARQTGTNAQGDLGFTECTIIRLTFATLKATIPDYIFPKRSGVGMEDQPAMGERRAKVVISKWEHVTALQTSLILTMVLLIALDHGQAVYSAEGWHEVL